MFLATKLTLNRALDLEKAFKFLVEDREDLSPLPEEIELKILMFGITKEIK